MMIEGIDSGIRDRVQAYGNNPQALMQRYQQNQELIDLLALQKIKSDKEDAKRSLMLASGQMPTVAQQRENEVRQMTQQEVAEKMGMSMPPMAPPQQGGPRPRGPVQAPGGQQEGLGAAPAPAQGFAEGGIVPFEEGGDVEETRKEEDGALDTVMRVMGKIFGDRRPGSRMNSFEPAEEARFSREDIQKSLGQGGMDEVLENEGLLSATIKSAKKWADDSNKAAADIAGNSYLGDAGNFIMDSIDRTMLDEPLDPERRAEMIVDNVTGIFGDSEETTETPETPKVEAVEKLPEGTTVDKAEPKEEGFDWDNFWDRYGKFSEGVANSGGYGLARSVAGGMANMRARDAEEAAVLAQAEQTAYDRGQDNLANRMGMARMINDRIQMLQDEWSTMGQIEAQAQLEEQKIEPGDAQFAPAMQDLKRKWFADRYPNYGRDKRFVDDLMLTLDIDSKIDSFSFSEE